MKHEWLISEFSDLSNIAPLSQGGQKWVYSAKHASDGDVVLKIMHPNADAQRTYRELLAVKNIQPARVPIILGEGTVHLPIGECFWFREQRVPGHTLRTSIARGLFNPVMLLRLALNVSETLALSEAINIVHRDVKPENIIERPNGEFWLIDFGLSRHLGLDSLTETAHAFGNVTWGYAPIEQCKNVKREIDSRADLFALGVVLYECATGTNPFRAGAKSVLDILNRVEAGTFPRLKLNFTSGAEFCDLIAALTQRQRIHRPPTASEAHRWIKEICDREGVN